MSKSYRTRLVRQGKQNSQLSSPRSAFPWPALSPLRQLLRTLDRRNRRLLRQ